MAIDLSSSLISLQCCFSDSPALGAQSGQGLPRYVNSLASPRSLLCVYVLNRALWSDDLGVVGRSRINTYMKNRRALNTVSYNWEA